MDTEKRFFVGDVVRIVASRSERSEWIGFLAMVEPWPEEEEQFVDGYLHNWLLPITERPDEFGYSPFMWPTRNLEKVS
ncbi:hypothetical protein SEA_BARTHOLOMUNE_231 [Streptomyces phage Bartholomune]|nr:hypothetical protein SEA_BARTHOLOMUNE_231 [Streptomyces phage Bartholomune]